MLSVDESGYSVLSSDMFMPLEGGAIDFSQASSSEIRS